MSARPAITAAQCRLLRKAVGSAVLRRAFSCTTFGEAMWSRGTRRPQVYARTAGRVLERWREIGLARRSTLMERQGDDSRRWVLTFNDEGGQT